MKHKLYDSSEPFAAPKALSSFLFVGIIRFLSSVLETNYLALVHETSEM